MTKKVRMRVSDTPTKKADETTLVMRLTTFVMTIDCIKIKSEARDLHLDL